MKGAVEPLERFAPRSVNEALRMLRDEASVVPIAGATDLYVALNFGTLREIRLLGRAQCRSVAQWSPQSKPGRVC